jgi:DNA helicase II / ATP-dependent DNA helicase PcrA
MAIPGPRELGRSVVVSTGMAPPTPWRKCPRVAVHVGSIADPSGTMGELQVAWLERQPVVIELAIDSQTLQERERCERPVYDLTPRFEFNRERLHFLVWANSYDARGGEPIWWHGRKAARRFSGLGVRESTRADIELDDGTPLYVDGGPFAPARLASGVGVVHRWNAEAGSLGVVGHRMPDAELAPDQLAAVGHRGGSARVIAPAGSGKTRVLTERLRHLIDGQGVDPSTVTALAFNRKAANELIERSGTLVSAGGPSIRTLNSVGLWICNEFGDRSRLQVLEEPGVRDLVQRVFEVRRQANTDTVLPYIDGLSAVRLGLSSPELVEDRMPDAQGLAERFDRYRAALADAGAVDFDEQIYQAIEILLRDPEARSAAQTRSRHLLVDEFQDLNPAHMLLIRVLNAPAYDCFGVGDDDQVIYGYSGASPEYLIDFRSYFPGAHEYALEVNYRCPPAVVRAASCVLSYNADRIPKTIRTPPDRHESDPADDPLLGGRDPVTVVRAAAEELASSAVETISDWTTSGVALNEIAVLARVNSSLLPIQIALTDAGVPCTTPLDRRALERTGVRTALAYLRMGLETDALWREDVLQTVRRPSRGIARNVVEMATRGPMTSVADIRRLARALSGRDVPKLLAYADDIEAVAAACRKSTAEGLRSVRLRVGLGETMDVLDSARGEADRSTHADDLIALEAVAALHPDAASFEAWLRELLSRNARSGPSVLLSTIHKIKGREWEHVIVYGASKALFPHRLSHDEEGERRVFHVALTRAIRQVVILADTDECSPFVLELDGSRDRGPIAGRGRAGKTTRPESAPSVGTGRERARTGSWDGANRPRRSSRRSTVSAPELPAEVGLVLEYAGHSGRLVDLKDTAAVLQVGEARLSVPIGSEVRVQGSTMVLSAPRAANAPAEDAESTERMLRAWRSDAAKQASVPAYVVLNDAELAGIAASRPRTLAELSRCKGIGPNRLERWGDELLAVLSQVEAENDDAAGRGSS